MNFKKNVFLILLTFALFLFSTVALVFIIDPFQHYRKASFYKPYAFDQRSMIWGFLKNYQYDSVLVGTSMTDNFIKSEVDKVLNTNILKASLRGSSAYEQSLVIQKALKNKELKIIYYGLDTFSFIGNVKTHKRLPDYLINDNIWDDYKYFINLDVVIKNIPKVILANYLDVKKDMLNYDQFYCWYQEYNFSKKQTIKSYNSNINKNDVKYQLTKYKLDNLKNSFNINLLTYIEKNPLVDFVVFFPPYSILAYKYYLHNETFDKILKFKLFILNKLIKLPNVKIYDFQIADEVTHNLDNYKDITHYSEKINLWMVQQIKNNNYLINEDDIVNNINKLEQQAKAYELY